MAIGRPPSFGNQAVGRTANVGTSSVPADLPSPPEIGNLAGTGFIGKGNVNTQPGAGFTGKGSNKPLPALPRGDPIDAQGNYARPPKSVDPIDAQGNYARPGGAGPLPIDSGRSVVQKGTSFDLGGAVGKAKGWFSNALHTAANWANDNLVPEALQDTVGGVIDDVHGGKHWTKVVGNAAGNLGQAAINNAGALGTGIGGVAGGFLGGPAGAAEGAQWGGALGSGIQGAFGKPPQRKRQKLS